MADEDLAGRAILEFAQNCLADGKTVEIHFQLDRQTVKTTEINMLGSIVTLETPDGGFRVCKIASIAGAEIGPAPQP